MKPELDSHHSTGLDLIVMGSGCGGMTTALIAAIQGYRVMVVEKTDLLGGTTAYSSGTAWIPGTRLEQGSSPAAAKQDAALYLERMTQTDVGRSHREAFLASGRDAIDFLQDKTSVQFFMPQFGPDYYEGPGSAKSGRALVIKEFDGRLLGPDFALLREPRPGFNVLGGMMVGRADLDALMAPLSSWSAFRHASKILFRHARDRLTHRRGTRLVMGNALVGRLLLELRKHGVALRLNASIVELIKNDGRVTTAVIQDRDGRRTTVHARIGVVLATGGFSASSTWREKLLQKKDIGLSVAAPGNAGDGLALGVACGAAISGQGHRTGAFWMPTSIQRREGSDPVLFPHIVLDRAKPGLIAVGLSGKRFVNEANSYHEFVSAMLTTPGMGPDRPAWLVCDATFLWKYGLGLIRPWQPVIQRFVSSGYVLRARSITNLAQQMGCDIQELERSVQRMNEFSLTGNDLDFGRGTTLLNRQNGDPRQKPNPCLAPITKAPYYALAVWPADLATSAGLQTDVDARVIAGDGTTIAGLYAVGNDMASIMQGTYPGPGTTLGPAIVFAYRAVQHMVHEQAAANNAPLNKPTNPSIE